MKLFKPITPSLRHTCLINKRILWNGKSLKKLTICIQKNFAGRSRYGDLILYTRSTRAFKLIYRIIDFKYTNFCVPGIVYRIEYDPNRSSFITLIFYKNGTWCYLLHTEKTNIGSLIESYYYIGKKTLFKNGNIFFLSIIPDGSVINCVEKIPFLGSVYSRAAGNSSLLIRKFKLTNRCLVLLKSGTYKLLSYYCKATLGIISNNSSNTVINGKAGRSRWLGIKPNVRGVAMNPVDHPHGGGQGKKSNKPSPRTSWGKMYKWTKTSRFKSLNPHTLV
jgi:large subunit ribosomal protein L2